MKHLLAKLWQFLVLRVAIIYPVVAWLTVRLAALLQPHIGLPDNFSDVIALIAVANYPIVLIAAFMAGLVPPYDRRIIIIVIFWAAGPAYLAANIFIFIGVE